MVIMCMLTTLNYLFHLNVTAFEGNFEIKQLWMVTNQLSQITQPSKVRDMGVIIDQFLKFYDHINARRSTHAHIRNIGKIWNLISYDACSNFIQAFISCPFDFSNSIFYNVPMSKNGSITMTSESMWAYLDKIATYGTYYLSFEDFTLVENSR